MSRRRKIALALIVVVALLFGAATLWESNDGAPRYARVLLLDPRTGKTLRERQADGGYAVAALLTGGRVAVATVDSCLDGDGGSVTVLDATLQRVVSHTRMAPCTVARIDADGLRAYFGEASGGLSPTEDETGKRVAFGSGILVEGIDQQSPFRNFHRLTREDAEGRVLWQRTSFGGIPGGVDARDGRIVLPVLGTFTPGAD